MARLTTVCFCVIGTLIGAPAALAEGHRLGGGGALNLSLTRIVLSLLLCLMLAAAAAVGLKRSGGRFDLKRLRTLVGRLPARQRIEVLEVRRASQHADICLIRCDGREYLLLSSHEQQIILREQEASAIHTAGEAAA